MNTQTFYPIILNHKKAGVTTEIVRGMVDYDFHGLAIGVHKVSSREWTVTLLETGMKICTGHTKKEALAECEKLADTVKRYMKNDPYGYYTAARKLLNDNYPHFRIKQLLEDYEKEKRAKQ